MPTYNDSDTITESLDSIKVQNYKNWELIIINDGSKDNTEKVIKAYIKNAKLGDKIKYIYQENSDQLNALKNGLNCVTGDYIYILHSDDLLYDENTLLNLSKECDLYPNVSAFIPSILPIIDENSKLLKTQKIRKFVNNKNYNKELILSGGCNIFIDMALFKKDIFKKEVFYNYLTWNRPFWANIETCTTLKLRSLNFATFKYRVFEKNYNNSDLGLLNFYNGVLRTLIDSSENFYIPFYSLQRFFYKVFSKLNIANLYHCFSKEQQWKNKAFLIQKNIPKNILSTPYFKAIYNFYKRPSSRVLKLLDLPSHIYIGSNMREFNTNMMNNSLDHFYISFIDEVNIGFSQIITTKQNLKKVKDLLHFFCLKNVSIQLNGGL